MTQQKEVINPEAIQNMLRPINLDGLTVPDVNTKLGVMAASFDANVNRLLKDETGSLELCTPEATLSISSRWRNTLEGFGWVGPPSPWYEDTYVLEIAHFEEPEEYPDEKLKQFLKFVSSSILMPRQEKTRSRTVSLEFGTQAIIPTAPEMCAAFGIPSPKDKKVKSYRVEEAADQVEIKRRMDLKQAFGIGVVILEALDPKTVRKLKNK